MKNMRRLMIPIIIALVFVVAFQLLRMGAVVSWTHPKNTVSALVFDNRVEEGTPLINKNTLIIFAEEDVFSEKLLQKTEVALNYVKKDYSVKTKLTEGALDRVDLLIVATGILEDIGDLHVLIEYIENGGDVLFLSTFSNGITLNSIKRTLGIYEYGEAFTANSFVIEEGVIGEKSILVEETPWTSLSLHVRLLDDNHVYIRDIDETPLLWDRVVGEGQVMVANGTYFAQDGCLGLLVKTITQFDEISLYPVINSGVFVLEGYPISMEGNLDWIKTNYSRDIEGFVRDLWWPDMMKVADTNGIKYTASMYGVNKLEAKPPFNVNVHEVSNFTNYGIDLIQQGNELAISGYSPVALITEQDNYENVEKWSLNHMNDALVYIKEYFDYIFTDYEIRSYIAPNGVLTEKSLEYVKNQLQSTIISVSLEGDEAKQVVKTFALEDNIVWFPIISKGAETSTYEDFLIASYANSLGVISHELSFWDMIFGNESLEEPKLWEDVLSEYTEFAKGIHENYPWMKFMTISGAAQNLINQESVDLSYEWEEGKLNVVSTGINNTMSFILKTDKIVKPSADYSIEKIDNTHYLITVATNVFSIILEDK